jgi:hypothetical protein
VNVTPYTKEFYADNIAPSRQAAEIILPIVWELAGPFASVVDVGCGTGCWLDVARGLGAERILGVDGEYAREHLVVPERCFKAYDLNESIVRAPWLGRFGLCISLETAEHLEPESAETFIESLIELSDIVLFSAAIPGQGGTGHINEQWTAYWVKLFKDRGYRCADPLRRRIWDDQRIPVWYRQNIFFACNCEQSMPHFGASMGHDPYEDPMTIVHPDLYMRRSAFFY